MTGACRLSLETIDGWCDCRWRQCPWATSWRCRTIGPLLVGLLLAMTVGRCRDEGGYVVELWRSCWGLCCWVGVFINTPTTPPTTPPHSLLSFFSFLHLFLWCLCPILTDDEWFLPTKNLLSYTRPFILDYPRKLHFQEFIIPHYFSTDYIFDGLKNTAYIDNPDRNFSAGRRDHYTRE